MYYFYVIMKIRNSTDQLFKIKSGKSLRKSATPCFGTFLICRSLYEWEQITLLDKFKHNEEDLLNSSITSSDNFAISIIINQLNNMLVICFLQQFYLCAQYSFKRAQANFLDMVPLYYFYCIKLACVFLFSKLNSKQTIQWSTILFKEEVL